jgi:hypothetical protein
MPCVVVYCRFRVCTVLLALHVCPYSSAQNHIPALDQLRLLVHYFPDVQEIAREALTGHGALVGFRPLRCLFPLLVWMVWFRGPRLDSVRAEETIVNKQCEIEKSDKTRSQQPRKSKANLRSTRPRSILSCDCSCLLPSRIYFRRMYCWLWRESMLNELGGFLVNKTKVRATSGLGHYQ